MIGQIRVIGILSIFLHGNQGELYWRVDRKITRYGQELTLFCVVENCCTESAGWAKQYSDSFTEPIFLNVKNVWYNKTKKYDGRIGQNGFFLFIRNFSIKDTTFSYSCSHGFNTSSEKYLRRELVFEGTTTVIPWTEVKNDRDVMPTVTILLLITILLVVLVIAVFLFVSLTKRRQNKRNSDTQSVKCTQTETDHTVNELFHGIERHDFSSLVPGVTVIEGRAKHSRSEKKTVNRKQTERLIKSTPDVANASIRERHDEGSASNVVTRKEMSALLSRLPGDTESNEDIHNSNPKTSMDIYFVHKTDDSSKKSIELDRRGIYRVITNIPFEGETDDANTNGECALDLSV